MTKSTSSEVLYLGWSTVISSPLPSFLPLLLLPNRDSPCRNSQTAAETCVRGPGQSLSTRRRFGCRDNQDRPGVPRWYAGGAFQKSFAHPGSSGTCAAARVHFARQKNAELRPAVRPSARRISNYRGTFP